MGERNGGLQIPIEYLANISKNKSTFAWFGFLSVFIIAVYSVSFAVLLESAADAGGKSQGDYFANFLQPPTENPLGLDLILTIAPLLSGIYLVLISNVKIDYMDLDFRNELRRQIPAVSVLLLYLGAGLQVTVSLFSTPLKGEIANAIPIPSGMPSEGYGWLIGVFNPIFMLRSFLAALSVHTLIYLLSASALAFVIVRFQENRSRVNWEIEFDMKADHEKRVSSFERLEKALKDNRSAADRIALRAMAMPRPQSTGEFSQFFASTYFRTMVDRLCAGIRRQMCISIAFYCVINFVLWFYPLLVISNGNAKWSAGSAIGLTMFGVLVLSLTAGLSNISNSRILTLACYVALGVVSVWMSMTFASADGEVWKKWILSFTTFTSLLVLPILGTFRSLVKDKRELVGLDSETKKIESVALKSVPLPIMAGAAATVWQPGMKKDKFLSQNSSALVQDDVDEKATGLKTLERVEGYYYYLDNLEFLGADTGRVPLFSLDTALSMRKIHSKMQAAAQSDLKVSRRFRPR